jgi:hypothetical protein
MVVYISIYHEIGANINKLIILECIFTLQQPYHNAMIVKKEYEYLYLMTFY